MCYTITVKQKTQRSYIYIYMYTLKAMGKRKGRYIIFLALHFQKQRSNEYHIQEGAQSDFFFSNEIV